MKISFRRLFINKNPLICGELFKWVMSDTCLEGVTLKLDAYKISTLVKIYG